MNVYVLYEGSDDFEQCRDPYHICYGVFIDKNTALNYFEDYFYNKYYEDDEDYFETDENKFLEWLEEARRALDTKGEYQNFYLFTTEFIG